MTTRRRFILSLSAAMVAAGPAPAQQDAATASVVRQLERQGFSILSIGRTLLGRVRVMARRGDLEREIVFDPRNGAILRDYTVDSGGSPSVGPSPGQGEREEGEGPDDYPDDDDDDDHGGDDDSGGDDDDDDNDEDDGDDGGGDDDDGNDDDGGDDDGDDDD